MSAATHSEVAPDHQHDTTDVDLKAGRRKVARSRGVLSGILLLLLGAWAALAPFIGPYFDFGIEPRSGDAFHWTSGRGLYELLPGGVAFLAGIVLLFSASRVLTVLMAWLAALAGVWLVIGPTLDLIFKVGVGTPPTSTGTNKLVAYSLLYFLATGVAIALVAGIALGRLSVHSVRDVRAAERAAEAEAAAEAQRQEAERREAERLEAERRDHERRDHERRDQERRDQERREAEHAGTGRRDTDGQQPVGSDPDHRTAVLPAAGTVDRDAPTATQQAVGDDRYAAPSAGPYEQTGNRDAAGPYEQTGSRDAAGSSSYAGHRAMGTPDPHGNEPVPPGAHAADPVDAPPAEPAAPTGPAAAEPAPNTPPAPGGMEQYRYGTRENPVPPEEHNR